MMLDEWIERIEDRVKAQLLKTPIEDGSHDIGHLQRVSSIGRRFAREESANELIVHTAGMLHDIVSLPKNHPEANKSSLFAASLASELLEEWGFPKELIPQVCHAIHVHSFSAKLEPKTIEAMCLQDADRMEALGAFGLMRLFYVSGKMASQIMDEADPTALHRELDDKKFALDHFAQKLFTLYSTMKTAAGRKTAKSLSSFLEDFRNHIIEDHQMGNNLSSRFMIALTYQRAGQLNLPLFHPEDPFAEKGRTLDSSYALDTLLAIDDAYIDKFMDQLRFELNGYPSLALAIQ